MSVTQNVFTERELEILRLVATGASNKEIATRLSISLNTVKVHLRNIYAKINVTSRTEAALYAISNDLVQSTNAVIVEDEDTQAGFESFPGANRNVPITAEREASLPFYKKQLVGVLPVWGGVLLGLGVILVAAVFFFPKNTPTPPIEVYENMEFRWQALADMPTARDDLAVAVYEEKILAIGGTTADGVTGVVEEYSLDSNQWSARSPKRVAVGEVKAVTTGGKIYVPGGLLETGQPSNSLEIYDPALDRWIDGAPLPVALSRYALTAYEGKLYLFGGWDGEKFLNSLLVYDPDDDRWSIKSPMKGRRADATAVVSGERIFVLGGIDGQKALSSSEIYSPSKEDSGNGEAWSDGPDLPVATYGMAGTNIGEIIFLLGGASAQPRAAPYLLEFLPSANNWQGIQSLGEGIWLNPGLVNIGTKLYAVGGSRDGQPVGDTLSYQAIYSIHLPSIPDQ